MCEYTIRTARSDDHLIISELCDQLGYPTTPNQVKDRLSKLLNTSNQTIFVITQSGRIYGWVHILLVQYLESERFAEIGGLIVDQNQRGLGLGKQLMQAAENWARQKNVFTIRLRSNIIRSEAHKFYETLGYINQKTQFTFVKHLA